MIHLVKLCVGVESPKALARLIKQRKEIYHITRNFPKQADSLLEGGSLYWIFSGFIAARQKIIGLEPVLDDDGNKKCKIILDKKIVLTEQHPHRPFQGWRYLDNPPLDLRGDLRGDLSGDSNNEEAEIKKALGIDKP